MHAQVGISKLVRKDTFMDFPQRVSTKEASLLGYNLQQGSSSAHQLQVTGYRIWLGSAEQPTREPEAHGVKPGGLANHQQGHQIKKRHSASKTLANTNTALATGLK
jgi:hypothetical protein